MPEAARADEPSERAGPRQAAEQFPVFASHLDQEDSDSRQERVAVVATLLAHAGPPEPSLAVRRASLNSLRTLGAISEDELRARLAALETPEARRPTQRDADAETKLKERPESRTGEKTVAGHKEAEDTTGVTKPPPKHPPTPAERPSRPVSVKSLESIQGLFAELPEDHQGRLTAIAATIDAVRHAGRDAAIESLRAYLAEQDPQTLEAKRSLAAFVGNLLGRLGVAISCRGKPCNIFVSGSKDYPHGRFLLVPYGSSKCFSAVSASRTSWPSFIRNSCRRSARWI